MSQISTHRNEVSLPLVRQSCRACEGGLPLLSAAEITAMKSGLDARWEVVNAHHLTCRYGFRDFAKAMAFANRIGDLAEAEGHHPDITVGYGKLEILLYTHAVDGLTRNDFILAAKIAALG